MKDRINRVEIKIMEYVSGTEYMLIDYILYRSNLNGWRFWTTKISDDTGAGIATVYRTLKKFCGYGWMFQDGNHHYNFDYNKYIAWQSIQLEKPIKMEATTKPIEEKPKTYQIGNNNLSNRKEKPIKMEATRSIKEINKNNIVLSTNTGSCIKSSGVSSSSLPSSDFERLWDSIEPFNPEPEPTPIIINQESKEDIDLYNQTRLEWELKQKNKQPSSGISTTPPFNMSSRYV